MLKVIRKASIDYIVSLSNSRHLAAKQVHYKVGVSLLVIFANNLLPAKTRLLTIKLCLASCVILVAVQLTKAML